MHNPFDNVPSSADVQETTDKKTLSSLLSLVERFEIAASREEAAAKNQKELAGAVFKIFLDDDGSMKDFSHSVEIKSMLRQTERNMDADLERVENLVKDIPTTIEDRNRLDKNFQGWEDLLRLYFPIIICAVAFVVLGLIGGIMLSVTASNKKADYEHSLHQLDRWEKENADAISFGNFYRKCDPDNYCKGLPPISSKPSTTETLPTLLRLSTTI